MKQGLTMFYSYRLQGISRELMNAAIGRFMNGRPA